jgi:hypothetical protein
MNRTSFLQRFNYRLVWSSIAAASLLASASADAVCTQSQPPPTPVGPSHIRLVRTLLDGQAELATIIDLRQASPGNLATFLDRGGAFLFKDQVGRTIGYLNRDNAAAYQVSNAPPGIISVGGRTDNAQAEVNVDSVPHSEAPSGRSLVGGAPTGFMKRFGLLHSRASLVGASPESSRLISMFRGMEPQQVFGTFDGNMIPGRSDLFNAGLVTLPLGSGPGGILIDGADAIVAIAFTDTDYLTGRPFPNYCNGFQVSSGRILTNLHCAQPGTSNHIVHFGRLHQKAISGSPQLRGETSCDARVFHAPNESFPRLDFAVLMLEGTLPPRFGRAILPIDEGNILAQRLANFTPSGVGVTQIQYWIAGSHGAQVYGKYRFSAPACRIVSSNPAPQSIPACPLGENSSTDVINPAGIAHLCDTDGGSSGSALIDPATGTVLALHRGAGGVAVPGGPDTRANCAVPAGVIANNLRAWGLLN